MKAGIMISIGDSGGLYWHGNWAKRLCLGPVAITYFPIDGDELLSLAAFYGKVKDSLVMAKKALSDEITYREMDRRPPLQESEYEAEVTVAQLQQALGRIVEVLEREDERDATL